MPSPNSTKCRFNSGASRTRNCGGNFSTSRGVHVRESPVRLLCNHRVAGGGADDFNHAAKAIGLAILFDSLDGRVARMTGTNTEFGVQFDSLADVVSFGVAPAVLAYAWGIRSVSDMSGGGAALARALWLGVLFCSSSFAAPGAWRDST